MPDEKLKAMKDELSLLDIEEIMFVTGWGETTVREVMEEKDFPTLKIGKKNQVAFDALKEYVKHRRVRRGE